MALASRFAVDIHVVSLLDQNLTDADLISLFNQLPRRCLLLLEDIDTAGLKRKPKKRNRPRQRPFVPIADSDSDDEDEDGEARSRISLSGLLNAIDGVAAPEGHILIMTTNKPDELDEALVRSGRISVRVAFEKTRPGQTMDIFLRMFAAPAPGGATGSGTAHDPSEEKTSSVSLPPNTSQGQLLDMARTFATSIPENEFSPADLQDYLLTHKKDPRHAVEQVDAWKTKELAERARKAAEREKERQERAGQRDEKTKKLAADMSSFVEMGRKEKEKEKQRKKSSERDVDEGTEAGSDLKMEGEVGEKEVESRDSGGKGAEGEPENATGSTKETAGVETTVNSIQTQTGSADQT